MSNLSIKLHSVICAMYAIARDRPLTKISLGLEYATISACRISLMSPELLDYVLATGVPHKGRVLTQISLFWFEFLRDLVPNHLLTADVSQYPAALQQYADQLRGRSMIVARADMFPVECVVRGYISGLAWKEYKATGRVCGIELPKGL